MQKTCGLIFEALLLSLMIVSPSVAQSLRPVKVVIDGIEFTYIEKGSGEPLILLHGGMGDYRSWPAQMEALASKYRVISYSRRYSYPNRNPLTGRSYSAYVDADDLAAFLKKLKIKRAHLIGTSAGAFAALVFAMKHPKMVRSLVLAEPPVHQLIRDVPSGENVYQDFINKMWKPVVDAFDKGNDRLAMGIFYKDMTGKSLDELPAAGIETVMEAAPAMKALALSNDTFPTISKERIRRIKVPTLIITGEKTLEIHKLVNQELARLIPNVRQVTIPNSGHGSARENPDAFNSSVLEFLGQLSR